MNVEHRTSNAERRTQESGQECPRSEKISVSTAQHILRLLEGDWATEEKIVRFLKERYDAPTVLDLPPKVAAEIIRRPGDFIRAAKAWAEPELFGGVEG